MYLPHDRHSVVDYNIYIIELHHNGSIGKFLTALYYHLKQTSSYGSNKDPGLTVCSGIIYERRWRTADDQSELLLSIDVSQNPSQDDFLK
jgi:hypothetical protein